MEQALFQKSPNVHGRIPGQSFFQIADMQKQQQPSGQHRYGDFLPGAAKENHHHREQHTDKQGKRP